VRSIKVNVEETNGAWLVTVNGPVAAAEISYLSAALEDLIAEQPAFIVVDMTGVTLITSEGLGLLIRSRKTVSEYGGRFVISGLSGNVLDVFKMTRLDKVFTLYDTPEAALESTDG
jgi:anti-sigma B factor antagonist